jgi:hypothetical protein
LPPLAPKVSDVGNAALIEREAVTLPLNHAFGFELADVVPGCNRGAALADARTVAGFLDRGRETGSATSATVSVICVIPVALRQFDQYIRHNGEAAAGNCRFQLRLFRDRLPARARRWRHAHRISTSSRSLSRRSGTKQGSVD